MNTHRTNGRRVTVGLPTRYELIASDGRNCGTYPTPRDATFAAGMLFPDQEQDEDRTGKGWDVQVTGCE